MNQKIIARFPSLLEAEAAVNCLEAGGIPALVNNSVTGGMMPHASDALGGFTVSVEVTNEMRALELLKGVDTDSEEPAPAFEPPSVNYSVSILMKRAAYGAVLGCIFLPVIANLFSLSLYFKAYRLEPEEFLRHKGLIAIGMFFNVLVLSTITFLIFYTL